METGKSNANCLAEADFSTVLDINSVLENARESTTAKECNIFSTSSQKQKQAMQLPGQFYKEYIFSEPIEQVITYIAGWLIQRVALCKQCEEVLCRQRHEISTRKELFIEAKKYSSTSKLLHPNVRLISLVREMEAVFMGYIKQWLDSEGLAMTITCRIKECCNFEFLLREHPEHAFHLEQSIVKLFVITRIFYFVKFYNRDICPRNKKNAEKMARVVHK